MFKSASASIKNKQKEGGRNLSRKIKSSIITITMLTLMLFASFGAMPFSNAATETPRLSEIWVKFIATGVVDALKAGVIDTVSPDTMVGWTEIQKAIDAGFKPVTDVWNKISYVIFNCRDNNPLTGASLWPLNDTAFRQALAWTFGHDSKADAVVTVYGGPTNEPLDNMISPAFVDYFNPDIPIYYTSYDIAKNVLTDAGYYVSGDKLYGPNGQPLPDTITVLSYSDPQYITALYFTQEYVNGWNKFFDTFLGVTNVNFVINAVPQWPTLLTKTFIEKDFQVAFSIWIFDIFDLVDHCASWMSTVNWGNPAGVSNGYVDYLCSQIKYNLTETVRIQATKELQALIAENVWYMPMWVDYAFCLIHPDLTDYVRSLGYGFDNRWTWRILHWKTAPKTTITKWTGYYPDKNWNPAFESMAWLGAGEPQLFDPMLERDPWLQLKLVPWIAQSYTVTQITTPWGNMGQKITFNIRNGVYWHDSGAYNDTNNNGQWDVGEPKYDYPVTAEDVAFGVNFIRTYYLSTYYTIFLSTGVYDTVVIDPTTVEIYINSTDASLIYDIAEWSLRFPKHIWEKVNWSNLNTFDPAATPYKDWTGLNPPEWTKTAPFVEGMKALIGCGPFVFDYWSSPQAIGHLVSNQNYWCDWIREDINEDLKVDIKDVATAARAFASYPSHPRWSAPSDINDDLKIDIKDIAAIARKFGWKGI
jgi:ABC-type transport system substrate-binding protein